ncbi:MAG: DnaB-like helicase N-terminal domain-containing protein, partial [Oscillospiraceae bacterium]
MAAENELFNFGNELPYNLEAEQSVIASILVDASCIERVLQFVKSEYFYRTQHREIFSVVLR